MRERVLALLEQVAAGTTDPRAALEHLSFAPFESLDFATLDLHRSLRQGYPEVIFAPGKTVAQIEEIAARLAAEGGGFLVTRAGDEVRSALALRFPGIECSALGRTAYLPDEQSGREAGGPRDSASAASDDGAANGAARITGTVLIVTAGTSDLPVAEEAAVTAKAMRLRVARLSDVGVAGIHRLLTQHKALAGADVVIVVAGMDGALPSVVGGVVGVPVIAVPTSVGYGASFGGLAALLTMLNSCAAGVTVVNIDNGFGAAAAAARILRILHR